MKIKEYKIENESLLLDYLMNDLKLKRNNAKALLEHRSIVINDKIVTKYNYLLKVNDKLVINQQGNFENNECPFEIIYEDNDFIVINKPAGLLSISTDKEKNRTAYHLLRAYLNNKYEKLFILHRLDKETSGVLVFTKSESLKEALQDKWNEIVTVRKYYAIVKGKFNDQEKHVTNYLKENRAGIVYSTDANNEYAKKAVTDITLIKNNDNYSLLDVSIKTGRKNQIRVTLNDLGYPVIGDDKYGTNKSPIKRLCLHAYELSFINPLNNKVYTFKTKIPNSFNNLFKNKR